MIHLKKATLSDQYAPSLGIGEYLIEHDSQGWIVVRYDSDEGWIDSNGMRLLNLKLIHQAYKFPMKVNL